MGVKVNGSALDPEKLRLPKLKLFTVSGFPVLPKLTVVVELVELVWKF